MSPCFNAPASTREAASSRVWGHCSAPTKASQLDRLAPLAAFKAGMDAPGKLLHATSTLPEHKTAAACKTDFNGKGFMVGRLGRGDKAKA